MSSQFYSLVFKALIILNLTVNCILVYLGSIKPFIYLNTLFGFFALIWFLKGGYKLHYHKLIKKIKLFICSLWGAVSVEFGIFRLKEKESFDFV